MNKKRVRQLNEINTKKGPVVYWMSRDQRVNDNWGLIYASELAVEIKSPLIVVFSLVNKFLGATIRQYDFMLKGLKEIEIKLSGKKIPFVVLVGNPEKIIPEFVNKQKAGILITDFDPLRIKTKWKQNINKNIKAAFYEVDTHNIVPCWIASSKKEYAAYTIRPKIKKLLPEFLTEIPTIKIQRYPSQIKTKNDWEKIESKIDVDKSIKTLEWIKPGEEQANIILKQFIGEKLGLYPKYSNNPAKNILSNMSPYLHFGQISSQRIALNVKKSKVSKEAKDSFLEELIIRKELSDNLCFYEKNYDNFEGLTDWAKKTLNKHRNDKREYLYTLEEFEKGKTHDPLWNAAQMQMVKKGKMHGYMRMYWAKKILEWTNSPEEAIKTAIYLNDRYELDGRDPNGYTGILWSIGGVHDRAWGERPIFGKVRYMSYNSTKTKFDIKNYIKRIKKLNNNF